MTMHGHRENSRTTLLPFLTVTAMLVVSLLFAPSAHAAAPKLAFVSVDNDIWTIAVDGTGARHLTHGTAYDGSPVWSPRWQGDRVRSEYAIRHGVHHLPRINGRGRSANPLP